MSVHPLKSILMSEPWKKSEETTKTLATLQPMNHIQMQKQSRSNLSMQHISWLWVELTKIYGALFITKFGQKDNGTWFETLKNLTPKALETGMDRLRNLSGEGRFIEYPPNCLQFKALCMSFYNNLNLPKPTTAYREIKNSIYKNSIHWSHPLIEYIAKKLPDHFFEIKYEIEAYDIFKKLYEQVSQLVEQGHEIPKIEKPQRVPATRNPEVARVHLKQIKQRLGA